MLPLNVKVIGRAGLFVAQVFVSNIVTGSVRNDTMECRRRTRALSRPASEGALKLVVNVDLIILCFFFLFFCVSHTQWQVAVLGSDGYLRGFVPLIRLGVTPPACTPVYVDGTRDLFRVIGAREAGLQRLSGQHLLSRARIEGMRLMTRAPPRYKSSSAYDLPDAVSFC